MFRRREFVLKNDEHPRKLWQRAPTIQNLFTSLHHFSFMQSLVFLSDEPLSNILKSKGSSFVTLLSRRAQSGKWSSYQETGVVHRITYSFSDFLFYLCFIYSFYSWYNKWSAISSKTTRSFLGNWHTHFSILPHSHLSYATDFLTGLLASVISA